MLNCTAKFAVQTAKQTNYGRVKKVYLNERVEFYLSYWRYCNLVAGKLEIEIRPNVLKLGNVCRFPSMFSSLTEQNCFFAIKLNTNVPTFQWYFYKNHFSLEKIRIKYQNTYIFQFQSWGDLSRFASICQDFLVFLIQDLTSEGFLVFFWWHYQNIFGNLSILIKEWKQLEVTTKGKLDQIFYASNPSKN